MVKVITPGTNRADDNSDVEEFEPPPRELTLEEELELENSGKCL